MYQVNPMYLLNMLRSGKNPEQLMLSVLQSQTYNNPLGKNLLNLAKSGRTDELEKVIRNMYAQQGGKNFDQDFEAFKKSIGYNI